MISLKSTVLFIALGTAAACATTPRAATSSGGARWTGSLRSLGSGSSATLNTSSTDSQGSSYGNISVTEVDSNPPTSHVDLVVNSQSMSGRQLAWAIFSGACGSPSPAVAGLQEFPYISMSSGSGHVSTDLRFRLRPGMEYHVNVYGGSRATDVADVIMCTMLTRGR